MILFNFKEFLENTNDKLNNLGAEIYLIKS